MRRIRDEYGIRSIICLLEKRELVDDYGSLNLHPDGLLGYYEHEGLKVNHVETIDNRKTPFEAKMIEAAEAFDKLPKPVLVHCAAGQDRTPPISAFIALQSAKSGGKIQIER